MLFGPGAFGPEVRQRISTEGCGSTEPTIPFLVARMQKETGENPRSKVLFRFLPLETNAFQPGCRFLKFHLLPTAYSKSACASVYAQMATAPSGLKSPRYPSGTSNQQKPISDFTAEKSFRISQCEAELRFIIK